MATFKQLTEGMKILAKYVGEDTHIGGAEHDILYVGGPEEGVSEEDRAALEDLGWHVDEDMCWSRFC